MKRLFFLFILSSQIANSQTIGLQGYGSVSKGLLDSLAKNITAFYGVAVKVLPVTKQPSAAFTVNGTDAKDLAHCVEETMPKELLRIIAITDDPLIEQADKGKGWNLFGYASGDAAVASVFALQQNTLARLTEVVLHELGHTFGAGHCGANSRCLMNTGDNRIATLDREPWLCNWCRRDIKIK